MKFVQRKDRSQIALFPMSLEDSISQDNEVRLIDLFVDALDLKGLGFRIQYGENGRPAYHPSDLLKLYIYGYLNKTRSSRDLEKECHRNLEVMWLLSSLTPDHNTIANFRKDNPKAIKKVFRATVQIARNFELIGGKLIAGDSTKLRAQNAKKNNYNKKKIKRHIEYIENKLEGYNKQLAEADGDNKKVIKDEIDKHNKRKGEYQKLDKQLDETGEKQVSTSDPDSRNIMIRNNFSEVAYSVQTTVDAEHNIPIDYKLSNQNDAKAMGIMLERAVDVLETNNFTALYDKGYHTGSELKKAEELGVKTIVAIPAIPKSSQAPDPNYNVEHFEYNQETDTYTCHQQKTLTTTGTWYQNKRGIRFKQYKTNACQTCEVRSLCTKSAKGRVIARSEYSEYYERNKEKVEQNKQVYKKRQMIVEHPYGTIKRQWGFDYIITKRGMERASGDAGLMFTAYNLRRLLTILGGKQLRSFLRTQIQSLFNKLILHIENKVVLDPLIFAVRISCTKSIMFLKP